MVRSYPSSPTIINELPTQIRGVIVVGCCLACLLVCLFVWLFVCLFACLLVVITGVVIAVVVIVVVARCCHCLFVFLFNLLQQRPQQ